jgi:hypothetical protein
MNTSSLKTVGRGDESTLCHCDLGPQGDVLPTPVTLDRPKKDCLHKHERHAPDDSATTGHHTPLDVLKGTL